MGFPIPVDPEEMWGKKESAPKQGTCIGCKYNNAPFCDKKDRDLSKDDYSCWESGKTAISLEKGVKNDSEKLDWTMLDLGVMEKVVEVLQYGSNKYARDNWKNVDGNRFEAAAMRHKVARLKGEKYDQESGLLHAAHEACNLYFILCKELDEI